MTSQKTTDQNFNDTNKGQNSASEPEMQQPGEVIVPNVTDDAIHKVALELYGLTVTSFKQLNGYDDKNYHIRVSPTSSNPHLTSPSPEGYVMKIINTMDTNRPEMMFAQIAIMNHLRSHGIATQEHIPTIQGTLIDFYLFDPPNGQGDPKRHAVCLRTYLPGEIYYTVTLTHDLCYQLGVFQAQITNALQDFHHPFYENHDYLWSMDHIPKLTEFVHAVSDVSNRQVVDDVIQQYTERVLPRKNDIRKGYIHGDPNEQNILVLRCAGDVSNSGSDAAEDKYVISGILDYQDAGLSHPLYDLSMLIAYASLQALTFDPLEVGGHILAGYTSVMGDEFPALERSLLRVSVAGRLAQSLVLGAYNHSLDPSNTYLLTTAKKGWTVLHKLWSTEEQEVDQLWDSIQQSYTD